MGDVNSCGLRQSSEETPAPALPHIPAPHQKTPPARTRVVAQHKAVRDDESSMNELSDENGDLGPFGNEMPQNLVRKLGGLILEADPYIAREIAERASKCVRAQFLKQCARGNEDGCKMIWEKLEERDRRDFYRACQYKPNTTESFFLDIMEPDSYLWRDSSTDCGSSVSDAGSAYSASGPGSDTQSVVPSAQDLWAEPYSSESAVVEPSSSRDMVSDLSFNSLASAPRRRLAGMERQHGCCTGPSDSTDAYASFE